MPLPALSLWPGRQPYTPRLVGGRRGGGPSPVSTRSRNPPTGRREYSPISSPPFSHGLSLISLVTECSPAGSGEDWLCWRALNRPSRRTLGHLQSNFDGGWHVCQAIFPEPQSAAARRRVERRDCVHEALPRLQSASSLSVMEQLVSGVCRLSCAFPAAGISPPDVSRCGTGQYCPRSLV